MFFDAGHADIHATHVDEAGPAQPEFQRGHRGQKPDVAHLRVTVLGHQRGVFVAVDHQCLQHQLAAPDQTIFQIEQVVDGGAAVIEHTHGEHSLKAFELRG